MSVSPGGVCGARADSPELDVAEAASFALLNELRVGLGLDPLVRDEEMDAFARDWSATMDTTGRLEHSSGPYDENIAWFSWGQASPEEAVQRLHDQWVTSTGHYANMTASAYVSVGIGLWRSDEGGWHATHVFSRS